MKAVVCLSGGLDSAVALYSMLGQGWECSALTVDYGQVQRPEIAAAREVARVARVDWQCLELGPAAGVLGGSALTHGPIDNLVVPNRNAVLVALATARAEQLQAQAVVFGAHADDHATWPDCRPAFRVAMGAAVEAATEGRVVLVWPFLEFSKRAVVELGQRLGVPLERTWSCYRDRSTPCGECPACLARLAAT